MLFKIAAIALFLPWALYHEYQWLIKRWGWRWVKGKIIGRPESVGVGHTLMDYFLVEITMGDECRQVTAYDHRLFKGSSKEVECGVSPAGVVEIYSRPQRALGTIAPLGLLVLVLMS